ILYALRDVTGTVENLSLIVASILSKKLASGTTGIVFDVKTGDGAFMKALEDSRALGRALVDTSRAAGRQASGWITDMSRPLGRAVGNALETEESIKVLRNEGPAGVREICLVLGAEMLRFAEPSLSAAQARRHDRFRGRVHRREERGRARRPGRAARLAVPGRPPRPAPQHGKGAGRALPRRRRARHSASAGDREAVAPGRGGGDGLAVS